MASNTTRLAIPYPGLSDPAQITVDMGNIATTVDTKVTGFIQQTTQPSNIAGYLWWCTDSTSASYGMNYCDGTNWHRITTDVTFSASAPAGAGNKNQFWINTTTNQISLYDGTTWNAIKVQGSNITGNIDAAQLTGSIPSSVAVALASLASGSLPSAVYTSKLWSASGTGANPASINTVTGYNNYIIVAAHIWTSGTTAGENSANITANTQTPAAAVLYARSTGTLGNHVSGISFTTGVACGVTERTPSATFNVSVVANQVSGTSNTHTLFVIGLN